MSTEMDGLAMEMFGGYGAIMERMTKSIRTKLGPLTCDKVKSLEKDLGITDGELLQIQAGVKSASMFHFSALCDHLVLYVNDFLDSEFLRFRDDSPYRIQDWLERSASAPLYTVGTLHETSSTSVVSEQDKLNDYIMSCALAELVRYREVKTDGSSIAAG